MQYIVTVKLPRNPAHDPKNKQIGICPVNGMRCTDVTGQHHSFLLESDKDEAYVLDHARTRWGQYHLTRIEALPNEC
jgi:hypothetical protein